MKFLAVLFYLCFLGCLILAVFAFQTKSGFLTGLLYLVLSGFALAAGDKLMEQHKN